MNGTEELGPDLDNLIDRRRWITGAVGVFGLTWSASAVRSAGDQPGQGLTDPNGAIGPMEFDDRGYRIIAHAPQSRPEGAVPIVFLFGGNGMGAVVRSAQADQLARDLTRRGVAAVVVNYPNLTADTDLLERIVQPMADLLDSDWARLHRIDRNLVGAAGFSAGGLIATLLATRYAHALPFRLRSSLNFYGPVDLRQWFEFHRMRSLAPDAESIAPRYRGMRGPDEIGHSPHGSILCRDLSHSLRAKVSENIGGLAPRKLDAFSDARIWDEPTSWVDAESTGAKPSLFGAFGTRDDNCDAVFQPRVLQSLGALHQLRTVSFRYDGPHGVSWRACPESVEAFLRPLFIAGADPVQARTTART